MPLVRDIETLLISLLIWKSSVNNGISRKKIIQNSKSIFMTGGDEYLRV